MLSDKASGILVVPYWKSQPWFPLFEKMIEGDLLLFGPADNILFSAFSDQKHPLVLELILAVARISAKPF